jgi:hypothetical protein
VHGGDNAGVEVEDVNGVQVYNGYNNVEQFLGRIVPTFADAPHVLVTGVSAGGFGAGFNYHRIARSFPGKVTLLDDSGPPMRDEYLAPCLQATWRAVWGLDSTIPGNCPRLQRSRRRRHLGADPLHRRAPPRAAHGPHLERVRSNDRDLLQLRRRRVRRARGDLQRGPLPRRPVRPARRGAGAHRQLGAATSSPGIEHTWIGHSSYYSTEVDGVRLVDWLDDLLAGEVAHVSP